VSIIAITNILFTSGKSIGGIQVDAFVKETHKMSAELSSHPTETGTVISDNIVNNPEELTIEGSLGQTSLFLSDITSYSLSRAHVIDTQIIQLMTLKLPVVVITGLRVYDNMVITSYDVDRSAENGQSLEFSMELRRAVQAQAQFTNGAASAVSPASAGQATNSASKGTQAATDTSSSASTTSHQIPDAEAMLRGL
jgi:hypothetical protein